MWSPFIEMGVGFRPELSARDNVLLNAAVLGIPRAEARERLPEVLAFADLEGFAEQKLKNFSSGMAVRLAFASALQAKADILLLDEVLAVGDEAFQEKCHGEFERFKGEGRTVLFVTHDMAAVERFCDRAVLLDGGSGSRSGPCSCWAARSCCSRCSPSGSRRACRPRPRPPPRMPAVPAPLTGKVALVAGATRGAGRGTAVALGEAGATVYCTGRTTRQRRSEYDRPETIEQTAELVDAAGGEGIAVEVDHLEPAQVEALVRRIDSEQGGLDVLVNDIWGGEKLVEWNKPVWEHDLDRGLRLLRLAIDTHLITSHFALALLIRRPGGLVVEMTDGTLQYNAARYRLSAFYDLAKTAVIRLAFAQGNELAPHDCTAVALTPGWMRSEMMLEHYGVTDANWREAKGGNPHFSAISESPRFVGRAVAALAADPDVHARNGGSFSSGGLAREYGFTDVDGSQPDCWTYMAEVQDPGRPPDPTGYR